MGFPFSSGADSTFQGHPNLCLQPQRVCRPSSSPGLWAAPAWCVQGAVTQAQETVGPALPPQCPQGHPVDVPAWLCRAGEEDLSRSHAQAMTAQQDFPSFSRISQCSQLEQFTHPSGDSHLPCPDHHLLCDRASSRWKQSPLDGWGFISALAD